MTEFEAVLEWLKQEREAYQTKKFDYEEERDKPVEYWIQQFESYIQRLPIFSLDTPQGCQAALKLAATAVALSEHIIERLDGKMPKPGVPSGEIRLWQYNQ